MAKTFMGDYPGHFFIGRLGSHAAVANDAEAARLGSQDFVAPANLKILSAWRQVRNAEATASEATRYRTILLVNGGTSGTATGSLARATVGTAVGALQYYTHSFALAGTPTVTQGGVIYASAGASVGLASNDSTALVAGVIEFAYELI